MATHLPNPFTDLSRPVTRSFAFSHLNEDPLPLFLTQPAPALDDEIEALVRAVFWRAR